ncbi:MAG: FHA domain-containing protein [Planctomycetes bacterium]|nr:FHA domain-containing protein [Planctomycetota bacterium]
MQPPGASKLSGPARRLAPPGGARGRPAPASAPRPLDATISERPAASALPGWSAAFQLVRLVDGFPLRRHVFGHGIVRVGRGEDCDLRLDDPLVSRYHALIERQPGDRFVVHDQLSSNGIQVNGERIDRARPLRDGDVLLLGSTRLVFQAPLTPLPPAGDDPEATVGVEDASPFPALTPPSGAAGPARAGGAVGPGSAPGRAPDGRPAAPPPAPAATPAPRPPDRRQRGPRRPRGSAARRSCSRSSRRRGPRARTAATRSRPRRRRRPSTPRRSGARSCSPRGA